MAAQEKQRLTPEEYFALEEKSEFKSEYRDGVMVAMAGGEPAHSILGASLSNVLITALDDRPCTVYNSDVYLQAGTLYTHPDAAVVCEEPRYGGFRGKALLNPSVLVEVLSESTEAYDRGEKFARYRRIESLVDYLLISQDKPLVEHYVRQPEGLWLLSEARGLEAAVTLASVGCELRLSNIYRRIVFENSETGSEEN